jgi:hypothetical protein
MLAYTEKIQETARKLLKDKTVDVFIGYRKGTVAMMNEPVLIRDLDKVDMQFQEHGDAYYRESDQAGATLYCGYSLYRDD